MKFSIPFNGDWEYLSVVDQMLVSWNKIASIYLAPNPTIIGSGRKPKIMSQIDNRNGFLIFNSDQYDEMIIQLMKGMQSKGVKTILLLNAAYYPYDINKLIDYLSVLYHQHNLSGVVIGTIEQFESIDLKKYFPKLELHNSIYMKIDNLEKAKRIVDKGLDVFLLPPELNRKPDIIETYKNELSAKLKIMVNEGCLSFCPFREEHHILDSTYSVERAMSDLFFKGQPNLDSMKCRHTYNQFPEMLLQSPWIRPEDLSGYEGLVDYVKIVGRSYDSKNIANVINSYLLGKYSGDLRFLVEAFKNVKVLLDYEKISESSWKHINGCTAPPGQCATCHTLAVSLFDGQDFAKSDLFD